MLSVQSLLAFLSGLLKALIVPFLAREHGKKSVKLDNAEKVIDEAKETKNIHNRVILDSDYHSSVRDKFRK